MLGRVGPDSHLHESGSCGELDTGATSLAFASEELGAVNHPEGYVRAGDSPRPLGMEIALVTADVAAAFGHALEQGARELAGPRQHPGARRWPTYAI